MKHKIKLCYKIIVFKAVEPGKEIKYLLVAFIIAFIVYV